MPIMHCTPRALFTPLYTKENLFFCTEELGSESISTSSAATKSACEAQSSQGLHRSFQQEASDNRISNERNRQGGETRIGIEDNELITAACKSSYANNLSLSTHVRRTFPPPISSLLSDRPILRTLKFDGRFVLQIVDTISTSSFSVIRGNGRLRLIVASLPSCGLDFNEHSISRSETDGYEEHGTDSQEEEEEREEVVKQPDKTIMIAQNAIDLEAFASSSNTKGEMARPSSIFVPRSMNILGCIGDTSTHEFLPTILRFLLAKKLSKMGSYYKCKGSIRQHSSDMQHNLLSISSIQSSPYSALLNKTQLSN